jgi:hypothetical protein
MKKLFLLFTLITCNPLFSQCVLHDEFNGNTGSNMTIMLAPGFINSLTISSPDAYIVATTSSDLVVGSTGVYGMSQTTLAIWGDDTDSPETDGALPNENITLHLVDGADIYELSIPTSITYSTNGMVVQSTEAISDLCGEDVSPGSCDLPEPFIGNTGSNMTVMLTSSFMSSLPTVLENAYILALTANDMVVGSTSIFGLDQTSLAIWGDDTDSPEVDGAVSGEAITLQLVNGTNLYNLTVPSNIAYTTNGMVVQNAAATYDICGDDPVDVDCEYPGIYSGNTGNNMTVMLTSSFMSTLNVTSETAYIAVSSGGILVGSVPVYGVSQTSLAIWGDDSSTTEVDGAVIGESVELELVDGSSLFLLSTQNIPFVVNGTQILTSLNDQTLTCGLTNIEGCTEEWAENFNPGANINDNSCILTGCMDSNAANFVELANIQGACVYFGCTNVNACNYDIQANNDDDSCFFNETGYDCANNCLVDTDSDGVCDGFEILGCMDNSACNFNDLATDAGFCTYPSEDWLNCDELCNNDLDNDGVCDEFEVDGCIDPTAFNFNTNATNDDGTCIPISLGCTNSSATNYNDSANTDNGSCLIEGCTNPEAYNFNVDANINDGSCQEIVEGCTDSSAANYNPAANIDDNSCEDIVYGCIDSNALNFNFDANTSDDSCEFLSFSGNWPSSPDGITNTGNNATIGVSAQLDLETGDYLGAFYESDGALVCGGLLVWDATSPNQLIVVWGNDANNETKDGFNSGEQIIWMSRDVSEESITNLYPVYTLGSNTYMVNAVYIISDWIIEPEFGCMDQAYQEYSATALVEDGSCSVLWSALFAVQATELAFANAQVDELSTSVLNLNNTLNITVLSMQSDFDNMELDYQSQLFVLDTWLNDSLNDIHASYTAEIELLTSTMNSEILALESDLEISNEALIDSISSYEFQLSELTSSLEAQITTLQSASLVQDQLLTSTILDYDLQISNLNTSWDAESLTLNTTISELTSEIAATTANYDAQIESLIASNNAEIFALNGSHVLAVEALNNAAAEAADAASDLLNQTIDNYSLDLENMEFDYESQLNSLTANYENTIAVLNANDATEDALYQAHIISLQTDSLNMILELTAANENIQSLDLQVSALSNENLELTENLAYHSEPISVALNEGWNMIGFSLQEEMDAAVSLEVLGTKLHLIKDNNANVYWPEFGFNSLGFLIPGQGYQIRMYEEYGQFTFPYLPGERLDVYPQVPNWATEMEIPSHPNDTPSLIRVVNMLGQEVSPANVFEGEVLLYLYSDGSVQKAVK